MREVIWMQGHPPMADTLGMSCPTEYGYHDIHNFSLVRRVGERDDCLLYITLNGNPRLWHDTLVLDARRGQVNLYLGGEAQQYGGEHWEGWWFHFYPSHGLQAQFDAHGVVTGRPLGRLLSDAELDLLAEAFTYPAMPPALAAYRCANLIERTILSCLPPPNLQAAVPRRTRMRDIILYIQMNLRARHTVALLAQMAHLSPSHFAHLFREETGVSVHAYLTRERMQRARHLLVTTQQSAAQIGREVGYDDPYHFYAAFKKAYSVPPLGYRKALGGQG